MIRDMRSLTDTERRCLQERLTLPCPVTVASTAKWALIWFVLLLFLGTLAAGVVALQPHPVLAALVVASCLLQRSCASMG